MQTPSTARRLFATPLLAAACALMTVFPARADYPSTVLGDGPQAYYRLNDDTRRSNINRNSTSLGSAGDATNINAHPFPGALAGDGNRSQFFDSTARTIIPWNAALNPANNLPFTLEAWFYPASDQINGGQAVVNNRYSYSGVDRQGWVIFQRAQDLSYMGKPGYEGVGWNFRMYRGSGSSSGLDVVSGVPYQIGKWTQVVVVYDPVDVTNATLTMYIDGVAASTNIWPGPGPGYVANTDDHPSDEAVNGPAGLALGSYNNTQPGSNPYFGAVDELAFYSVKLTTNQILAHYQNGTNSARPTPYSALIQSDNPTAYLRLDELAPGPDIALNMGNLQAAGKATSTAGVRHPAGSALAGRADDGSFNYHWRNAGRTTTDMPWIADNNPAESLPFTFEGWFRPTNDKQDPGPSPVNNRYVKSGNRTGWVIYQRAPNASYSGVGGYSGVGWTFRMYHGAGSGGNDVLTGNDYELGAWQHFVVTWEPDSDTGNGNWLGTLTAYINGVQAAQNPSVLYTANTNPTEDGTPPADLAIGSYNAASGFGEDFEGDIDEVALYNNYVLTTNQIVAHYQAGTNSHPATNYETLVLNAAYNGEGDQRSMPATYFRFNDPAIYPAANSGLLGAAADASLVQAANNEAGPRPPAYAGFESSNAAPALDGTNSWVSLSNPLGLNVSGQIALEAWIKPGAIQSETASIISHGPPTPTAYDLDAIPLTLAGSLLSSNEVFLRIEGAGSSYVAGSFDGTNAHVVSSAVPAGDLGGQNWIHLVGTYDGANWRLFRNGVEIATAASAIGAVPVNDAGWAIGSTGNGWADSFAGSIDEVAIYGHALTANQVQAHYTAGVTHGDVFLKLAIRLSGSEVVITWPAGVLQESAQVAGPYVDILSAKSPYNTAASATTKFYRLRQ